ncbi:MAG: hypothetical protein ACRD3K_03260 [Edaphobacter sp.]
MAIAVFPETRRPIEVPSPNPQPFPSFSQGRARSSVGDLTVHRITSTHHGRTLLTLGHAAEHLVNSRRYAMSEYDHNSDREAVHLLMELSRSVFEEYAAEKPTPEQRLEDWVVRQTARLFE